MKIAQIAPLTESCPPRLYGGTERVVANLTDALVAAGHDVTLFASGDSKTKAHLVSACERALRLAPGRRDPAAYHAIQLAQVVRSADDFDILHAHQDFGHMPALLPFAARTVTTQHGRMDLPHYPDVFAAFPEMALVSISDAQRTPLPAAHWAATVYHGLPAASYALGNGDGGYLAFLGRICQEKGIETAIAISRTTGVPLKVAAKIDAVDRDYFEARVRNLIDGRHIEFVGEITDTEKSEFLGNARALVFPIAWPEPFGLVMIESIACGTPVIAFPQGSVPEIVEDGVTGFLVPDEAGAVAAVGRLDQLDRRAIRARFEARFTAERMAAAYVRIYETMLHTRREERAGAA